MPRRKIAVVTGSRTEYGLLYWLMREIQEDPELELQVIATAMHLSPEFGYTYRQIEADGFTIDQKIESLLSSDSAVGVTKSTGLTTLAFAESLPRLAPDIMVVLGDRFETLAAVQAAMLLKIPVAHIHGGEITEGVLDESIRHAVTKMSHLHFPVTDIYRRRLLQLGEQPDRVFNFGAPGLDHVQRTSLLNRQQLEETLGIQFRKTNILLTYHPVTLRREAPYQGIQPLFEALKQFPDALVVFTKSNADEGGRMIGKLIDEYIETNPAHKHAFVCLGLLKYLSLAKEMDVVVGNSSSGLIEVPYVKTATVNIGERQRGRLQATSVITCKEKTLDIVSAMQKALSPSFQASLSHMKSPYGEGDASRKIKECLKMIDLDGLLVKRFYDYPQVSEKEEQRA